MPEPEVTRDLSPAISRGRIDRLVILEISDAELDTLEQGSPASLFLNFALALLSVAVTIAVALASTEIKSERVFMAFLLVGVVGFVVGLLLLLLWRRQRSSVRLVIKRIRLRLPPEGVAETNTTATGGK